MCCMLILISCLSIALLNNQFPPAMLLQVHNMVHPEYSSTVNFPLFCNISKSSLLQTMDAEACTMNRATLHFSKRFSPLIIYYWLFLLLNTSYLQLSFPEQFSSFCNITHCLSNTFNKASLSFKHLKNTPFILSGPGCLLLFNLANGSVTSCSLIEKHTHKNTPCVKPKIFCFSNLLWVP